MAEIMVSVIMVTYNHDKYISKAIESVLDQETKFNFELVIGEDSSTDNTRNIIEEYRKKQPNKIRLFSGDKNVGSTQNEITIIKASKGKYLAFCEGDDYWTDSFKLQKQVDFLEANPDYGLVHSDVNHFNQKTGELTIAYNKRNDIVIPSGNIFQFLMDPSHSIKTMTVCLRRDLLSKYYLGNETIMTSNWKMIDISIWLMLSYYSKIKYMDVVTATYRLLPESMSRTQNAVKLNDFHNKIYSIYYYFLNNFCDSEDIRKRINMKYNLMNFNDAYILGDRGLQKLYYTKLKKCNYKFSIKQYIMLLKLYLIG